MRRKSTEEGGWILGLSVAFVAYAAGGMPYARDMKPFCGGSTAMPRE